jgi:HPr kinase/phosphorylase
MTLFGEGVIRNYKKFSMVMHLEAWDSKKVYNRLGLEEETTKIIDTEIPILTIPVRPGRNLPLL